MRTKSQKYPKVTYGSLSMADVMTAKRVARFWRKIDRPAPDLCHPWRGGRNAQGYGLFQGCDQYRGFSFLAHRLAYFLHHGIAPDGLVLHSCDNPCCCNPLHLRVGTHHDNMQDASERGRRRFAAGVRGPHDPGQAAEAWRLRYRERMSIAAIAAALGRHRTTIMRWTRAD